jgi:hypothetical protein
VAAVLHAPGQALASLQATNRLNLACQEPGRTSYRQTRPLSLTGGDGSPAEVRISDFQASSQAAVFLKCFTVSASGRRGGAGGHAARRQRSYGAQFKEKL